MDLYTHHTEQVSTAERIVYAFDFLCKLPRCVSLVQSFVQLNVFAAFEWSIISSAVALLFFALNGESRKYTSRRLRRRRRLVVVGHRAETVSAE